MSRKLAVLLISLLLLFSVACKKKEMPVPADSGASTAAADNSAGVEQTPAPTVDNSNEGLGDFSNLEDVYFDFDKSDLTDAAKATLNAHAELFKSKSAVVKVEGHCDERGTEDYNLALGERRASAVREYLISLGVSADSISTISYGETQPKDPGHDEAAWAKNRRAHFLVSK